MMQTTEPYKMIYCIIPIKKTSGLLHYLYKDKNIVTATVNRCRANGMLGSSYFAAAQELDIVNVAVPATEADELFILIREQVELDRKNGGLMYMTKLAAATQYQLPSIATQP